MLLAATVQQYNVASDCRIVPQAAAKKEKLQQFTSEFLADLKKFAVPVVQCEAVIVGALWDEVTKVTRST